MSLTIQTSIGNVSTAHPEPPAEIAVLAVVGLDSSVFRLQCHPADRARPRPNLLDLRVHRAGVDRPRVGWGKVSLRRVQVLLGIGREFLTATVRAEVIRRAVVLDAPRLGRRLDRHPTDRIGRRRVGGLRQTGPLSRTELDSRTTAAAAATAAIACHLPP